MEGGTLISAQPKSIVNHAIITPNFNTTTVDPIVDVRVEEIEAANMEKQCRKCDYEDVIATTKGVDVEGKFLSKPLYYQNYIFTK